MQNKKQPHKKEIAAALRDSDWRVRLAATLNPKTTRKMITDALRDEINAIAPR